MYGLRIDVELLTGEVLAKGADYYDYNDALTVADIEIKRLTQEKSEERIVSFDVYIVVFN